METIKAKLNEANAWFTQLTFEEMERVFRVKQDDFGPDDGYQDFVDYCEECWNALSAEEKIYIYNRNN